jgi:hypothetical protein
MGLEAESRPVFFCALPQSTPRGATGASGPLSRQHGACSRGLPRLLALLREPAISTGATGAKTRGLRATWEVT